MTRRQAVMIGQTVGHYEILEKIGEGGMGVVYRARDIWLDRSVALKFLSRELVADDDLKNRFIQEAKAASALDHPNICTIHTIDETDEGQLFIAMAYYEGETVKAKMRRGLMAPQEIVEIAFQVASGLQAAHELNIAHLDIKPANIMVTRDGSVKILDFGLSRFTSQVSERPNSGPLMGTVAYMSPERVQGEPAGSESDIWSLGVVLYEMATGTRPFHGGSDMSILYAVVHREFVPAIEMVPELPVEFDRIIRRCLLKDRRYRYRTVGQLAADLENLQQTAQAMTATVPWIYHRPWRTGSRTQRVTLTAAAAAVALVLLGAGLWSAKRVFMPPESQLGIFALDPEPILLTGFLNQDDAEAEWIGASLSELLDAEMDELIRMGWQGPPAAQGGLEGPPEPQLPDELYSLSAPFNPQRGFPALILGRIPEDSLVRVVAAGSYELDGEQLSVRLIVQNRAAETLTDIRQEAPVGEILDLVVRLADDLIQDLGLAAPRRPSERTEPAAEITSLLDRAQEHLRRLEAQEARVLLQEALLQAPQNGALELSLAEALLLLSRKEEAKAVAQQALAHARDRKSRLQARALLFETNNKLAQSIALTRVLWTAGGLPEDDPRRLDYGLKLANLLVRENRGKDARDVVDELDALHPDHPTIWLTRANAVRDLSRGEQLTAARRAGELARAQDMPMALAGAYLMEAEAYKQLGQLENAVNILTQARDIYARIGDKAGEAGVLNTLAGTQWRMQQLAAAKTSFDHAARLMGEIGNRLGQSRILGNMAGVLAERGDYIAAIGVHRQAIDIARDIGDSFGEATTYGAVAEVMWRTGDVAEAEEYFKKAIEMLSSMDMATWESYMLTLYGELLVVEGKLEEASRILSRALDLHNRTRDVFWQARNLFHQAELRFAQGDLAAATELYLESIRILEETNNTKAPIYTRALTAYSAILVENRQLEKAKTFLDRSLVIQDELADPLWSSRTRLSKALLLLEENKAGEAETDARQALTDLGQLDAVLDTAHAHEVLARCLLHKGHLDEARTAVDTALELLGDTPAPLYRLPVVIARVEIRLARNEPREPSSSPDRAILEATLQELKGLLATTNTSGFFSLALEIDLLQARALRDLGNRRSARTRLRDLMHSAEKKRFLRLSEEARRMLDTLDKTASK